MNIAIIFAGGVGRRMKSNTIPKQFLELHGKPIIIYTLEKFENHPSIDKIVIVCTKGWDTYLKKLLKKYGITKVSDIVEGGSTGQESRRNGINRAYEKYPADSIVLIHDGVRPLIDDDLISENISTAKKYGNAITVVPANETIVLKSDSQNTVGDILERENCQLARAPQTFVLNDIYQAQKQSEKDKVFDVIDSATLMKMYGHTLYTVIGSPENIKITTPIDFYIFKAIIDAKENSQVFG